MKSYKSYETERLLLKPTTIEDAEFIFELLNTPKWLKFIGDRNVHSVADAENYIKVKMLPQLEKLGFGNYTLVTKSNGTKIGTCGLFNREWLGGIDIGFAFLPSYEKLGYAIEAATKVKELAFNEFGIREIKAITTKDNISSQKLLEKLGLKYTGTINMPDDPEELLLYNLAI